MEGGGGVTERMRSAGRWPPGAIPLRGKEARATRVAARAARGWRRAGRGGGVGGEAEGVGGAALTVVSGGDIVAKLLALFPVGREAGGAVGDKREGASGWAGKGGWRAERDCR